MKRLTIILCLLVLLFCPVSCLAEPVESLSYAVFPYLPDPAYYQELIERRWAELEPDIPLIRADWNCYTDGKPDGIDVVMVDAVRRDALIAAGWIQPVSRAMVQDAGDLFPFALEGFTVEDELYGIPVFLCGNFLIYDTACQALAEAEHLTDLAGDNELLVVNAENPLNRPQYIVETIADTLGKANPSLEEGDEDCLELLDRLSVSAHRKDEDPEVARAYDAGIGQGYIGFSESMHLLKSRTGSTSIKAVSFSEQENIFRVYADAAAVTAEVQGERYEKCVELMNVMAEADVLTTLSVHGGDPQYLLLARKSPYLSLTERFPLYQLLEKLADNEENHVILTPSPGMPEGETLAPAA